MQMSCPLLCVHGSHYVEDVFTPWRHCRMLKTRLADLSGTRHPPILHSPGGEVTFSDLIGMSLMASFSAQASSFCASCFTGSASPRGSPSSSTGLSSLASTWVQCCKGSVADPEARLIPMRAPDTGMPSAPEEAGLVAVLGLHPHACSGDNPHASALHPNVAQNMHTAQEASGPRLLAFCCGFSGGHGRSHISSEGLSSLASSCPAHTFPRGLGKLARSGQCVASRYSSGTLCLGSCSVNSEHIRSLPGSGRP